MIRGSVCFTGGLPTTFAVLFIALNSIFMSGLSFFGNFRILLHPWLVSGCSVGVRILVFRARLCHDLAERFKRRI